MSEQRKAGPGDGEAVSPPRPPCHVGVVTNDIDRAMKDLSERFAVQWTTPSDVDAEYVIASGRRRWTITVAHSSGPIAIELIQGAPGSLWETAEPTRFHHYAFWSSDLGADVSALLQKSYQLELTVAADDGHPSGFAYLVRPGSARLELIKRAPTPDASTRPGASTI